jgi:hypothetical protein
MTETAAGSPASHSVITPECRALRGDQGAWDEAVARAKAEYDAIIAGWRESGPQPTLHLVLGIERPFVPQGEFVEVRVCEHGESMLRTCGKCDTPTKPAA